MTTEVSEVGAKGQLIQTRSVGTLGYDAALYWIEVQNEIVVPKVVDRLHLDNATVYAVSFR